MNRLLFQEVEDLFARAVGYDEPQRRQFLDQVARDHSREVRDMLIRLLARDGSTTRWTDLGSGLGSGSGSSSDGPGPAGPAVHRLPEAQPAGTVMDRFELIKRLGIGGHGEVYLAQQLSPVKRRVALKIIRTEVAGEQAIARFHAEQQALARMSHPGIAAVYEAALADQGRLFFAMEYIDGVPIDVYCDQRRLTVRERLGLFLRICHAVQHAHQRGLIHRDLKPTNILVAERDGEPTPVLIDFGIAVATQGEDDDDDVAPNTPRTAAVIGTPAYMSPEQAGPSPSDVDTRCDVYALGMVLCELLAGRTPFDVLVPADASPAQVRQAIVDSPTLSPLDLLARSDADLPSIAALRSVSPSGLLRSVRGDLDAVVRHAIARDREHRYQTVDALASDLRSVLEHRPVSVGSGSLIARSRKFVRRHRLMVGSTLVAAGLMLAAVVGTSLGMVRARRAAAESQSVSEFLQHWLTLARAQEKGSTVRFADVLADGSAMAGERFSDYPEHEGRVRTIIGETYYSLGLFDEALAELERASELLRAALGESDPATLSADTLLGQTFLHLGQRDRATAIADSLAQRTADADDADIRAHHLRARWLQADVLRTRGKYGESETLFRQLLPQVKAELGPSHPTTYNTQMSLAKALSAQKVLSKDAARSRELVNEMHALLTEVIEIQRAVYDDPAALPVATPAALLGEILADERRYAEADAIVRPMMPAIIERFSTSHWLYLSTGTVMAMVEYSRHDAQAAADYMIAVLEGTIASAPAGSFDLIGRRHDVLPVLEAAGRAEMGLEIATVQYEALRQLVGDDSEMTVAARLWVARFNDMLGRDADAAAIYQALRETQFASLPRLRAFHAGHLARAGRLQEAETLLMEVEQELGDGERRLHPAVRDELERLFAEVYRAAGREEDAKRYDRLARDRRAGK